MTTQPSHDISIDLGDRKHSVCVLDQNGEIPFQFSISNTREALGKLSSTYQQALIVHEVGVHSPWISRYFESLGQSSYRG